MSARAPWWLESDEQTCGFCAHAYAYHVERRCFDCDRPFCPFCVTTITVSEAVRCPECAAAGGEDARDAGGRPSSSAEED